MSYVVYISNWFSSFIIRNFWEFLNWLSLGITVVSIIREELYIDPSIYKMGARTKHLLSSVFAQKYQESFPYPLAHPVLYASVVYFLIFVFIVSVYLRVHIQSHLCHGTPAVNQRPSLKVSSLLPPCCRDWTHVLSLKASASNHWVVSMAYSFYFEEMEFI